MAKVTLSDLANLQNDTTATATINANTDATAAAFDNTISRDGTAPNQMLAPLDMNSQRIINLPPPAGQNDPVRLGDITATTISLAFPSLIGDVTAPTNNGALTTTLGTGVVTNTKLSTMAANTIKGNPTTSTAAPTDFSIHGLTLKATPASTDEVMLYDVTSNSLKKTTIAGSVSVTGVSTYNTRSGTVVPLPADYTSTQAFEYANQLGLNFVTPGNRICDVTPSLVWMVKAGFGSIWIGTGGTNPTGNAVNIYRINPVTGTLAATISVGANWPNSEIRGIIKQGSYMWFVDRGLGKIYRVDPATNTIVGTVTGFLNGAGGTTVDGCFGICTDGTYLYVTETNHLGSSKLYKLDPANIPTNGTSVTNTVARYAGGTSVMTLDSTCTDTHNPTWDGTSIWVPEISSNNALYQVNASTMVRTSKAATAAGGAWGTWYDGSRLWFSEISSDSIAYFNVDPGTGSTSGARFTLPSLSGPADIKTIRDEVWVAMSTYDNGDGTAGALWVGDRHTGAQKKIIKNAGQHTPALFPYNGDMWVTYSLTTGGVNRIKIDSWGTI